MDIRLIDANNLMLQVKAIHDAVDTSEINNDYNTGYHSATSTIMGLIAYMPTTSRWISVKDALPPEESDVLLLVKETEYFGENNEKNNVYNDIYVGWFIDGEWATVYCHGHHHLKEEDKKYPYAKHAVTHWMPLPEPPEEE